MISQFITKFFLLLILLYQKALSPLLGPRCRFYPTCSQYAHICLSNYSLSKAFAKISWRVLRCNPFNPGGIDKP
ncbi:MAG: membrane protein insertion efficiency factor YidD [Bdellovibrionota bacterium]